MPEPQTIDAIYAWVATEPDGGEGIAGAVVGGLAMPLIGADMERVVSLRPLAEKARKLSGMPIRLVRFSIREELEILP